MPKPSAIALRFEDTEVRATPDGRLAAGDILRALGQKDPKGAWKHLKKQYPELGEESSPWKFRLGAAAADTLSEKGVYKLLMVAKGPRSEKFREWVSGVLVRIREGDVRLAAEIADRQEDPERLAWLENRVRAKRTNKLLNGAIQGAGADCYREVARLNSRGATGYYPAELRAARGVKKTRDGYTTAELAAVAHAEALEAEAIESRRARGDGAVLAVAAEFSCEIERLRRQARGALSAPAPAPAAADTEAARYTLAVLRDQGYRIWLDGETPRIGRGVGAPPLTAKLIATLKAKREAFLAVLRGEAAAGKAL
jgi:prophage antirepressor-like protein